jgi:hypothetical protein
MTRKWGAAQDWVFRFLVARDGRICYLCHKEDDDKGSKTLWIEHFDNNPDNPDPSNLALAHPSCNEKKNPPKQFPQPVPSSSERENEIAWGAGAKAGARSDQMRPLYRDAMYNQQKGLFRNAGQMYPKQWVADILQEELVQIGTATTFLKYIQADISTGYLEEKQLTIESEDPKKPSEIRWVIERTLKVYPPSKLGMKE